MSQVMSVRLPLELHQAVKDRAKEQQLNPSIVQKLLLDAYARGFISIRDYIGE